MAGYDMATDTRRANVRGLFRASVNWIAGLTCRESPFGMEIILGTTPPLVPEFLRRCSGMFPERFLRVSVSVGSREIRPIWREHPKCGTLSC